MKMLFERISGLCFDQSVLKELEDQKEKAKSVSIGGDQNGGTIRKCNFSSHAFYLHKLL